MFHLALRFRCRISTVLISFMYCIFKPTPSAPNEILCFFDADITKHSELLMQNTNKRKKNYWGHGNVCSLYECICSLILGQKNANLWKCTINMLWWQSFSTLKHIFCIGQYESNKWPSRYPSCSQYFSLWTGLLYKKKNFFFFQHWILAKLHVNKKCPPLRWHTIL